MVPNSYKYCLVLIHILAFVVHICAVLDKNGNYAVLRGTTFTLRCFPPKNGPGQGPGTLTWTDEDGRFVIDARYTKQENGDLRVDNAHFGDSGVYRCKYRPSFADALTKTFTHKVIVYDLSGHKFVSTVTMDVTGGIGKDAARKQLRNLLDDKICTKSLCVTGNIKGNCDDKKKKRKRCDFSMAYEAVNQISDEKCDEDCVREAMIGNLKRAENNLEKQLKALSGDSDSDLKAKMQTFETKHLVTCRAGFHLIKAHYKRCFPCLPGQYSRPNSNVCDLCKIGFYQEGYGKKECTACPDEHTTDNMGAKSSDNCMPAKPNTGLLGDIKEGLKAIFTG